MNLMQILSILHARLPILVYTLVITVLTTLIVSISLPKSYTATTSIVVNTKGSDPLTGAILPPGLMQGYMATQMDIIASHNVALKVVDKLNLTNSPQIQKQFSEATDGQGDIRDWLADLLMKNMDVKPSKESSVINILYRGADPRFAAALANGFAQAYAQTSLQLKVEPARQSALWFDDQIKSLRENLERAQSKLSAYQREHGIIAVDERLDVETTRLADLSGQLVLAQSQSFDNQSRQKQVKQGNISEAAEVMSNPLIQNLKAQLVQSEAKLNEAAQHMGKNHPLYQSALADVENLRKRISEEVTKTGVSIGQTARVSEGRQDELNKAVEEQKEKILALKQQRDDIAVLTREIDSAQRIYDLAMQRYSQTNMEGQANQTDVSILNPAIPPLKPSSPKIMVNVIVSIILGLMLGVGFCLIVEMLDRRVRSGEDLSSILDLTVLAELEMQREKGLVGFVRSIKQLFWQRPAKTELAGTI